MKPNKRSTFGSWAACNPPLWAVRGPMLAYSSSSNILQFIMYYENVTGPGYTNGASSITFPKATAVRPCQPQPGLP